jgi:hypothetical protein
VFLNKENETGSQSNRAVDSVIVTTLCVLSFENFEGTTRQTDIHLLRQIYSELYDVTCLINNTYGISTLASVCSMLTGVVFSLYAVLTNIDEWGGEDITYGITFTVFFFKVTFVCHTTTNEARATRILVEKLLLERNCKKEYVKQIETFSLQLLATENKYTACGLFSLNLRLSTGVASVIASYIVILVQTKYIKCRYI